MPVRLALVVSVVIACAALVGAAAAAQTPGQWAKQANAVCARWNAHQKAVLPHSKPKTTAGLISAIKSLIGTNVTAFQQLRVITEPASERTLITTYLVDGIGIDAQFQDEIRALEVHNTAAFSQDSTTAGLLNQRANATLKKLGATTCEG